MYFLAPNWLNHSGDKKDHEIYSCHVSADGVRLATAGADGFVRVWSTEAIYQERPDATSKPEHKQLASMSHHMGVVHTVRFSGNGKYLASGADDKFICVYIHDPTPPTHASTFGTNEAPPVENWRIYRRLNGHDNDVQDLAWSCDSSVLVSVGLDSKVVVWSGYTFEKLKTIQHHSSHVKGITFDPANKWFATASDDRTIRIFHFTPPGPNTTPQDSVQNFSMEATISEPFKNSPLTTYFRRCSWSPDGSHIAAANAVNGPVSTVAIINRGSWDSEINLVGHEAPVEVCAFAPRMFAPDPPGPQNQDPKGYSTQHLVTVIACSGQDKTLTLWNTSSPRPVLVVQDIASKSITDVAWAPDAGSLFVTSLSGSIVCLVFTESDKKKLGYVVGLDENEKALAKFGGAKRGMGVIESPEGLVLEERSKAAELRGVEGRMGQLMGDGTSQPMTNGSGPGTTPAANRIPEPTQQQQPPRDINAEKIEKLKQRVTITKDGKKRVAPMLVSSSSVTGPSLPQTQLRDASAAGSGTSTEAPRPILDLSRPHYQLPPGGIMAVLLGNKAKVAPVLDAEGQPIEVPPGRGTSVLQHSENGLVPADRPPAFTGADDTPEWIRPAVVNPITTLSNVRLSVPRVRAFIKRSPEDPTFGEDAVNGTNGTTAADTPILEVKNPLVAREPARVDVIRKSTLLWRDFLMKPVLLATGSPNFWAVACEDGSIHIWTPAGRRLINALMVDAQPVILECRGWWLMTITSIGMAHVWNLRTMSSPHPPVSLAPILLSASHPLEPHPTPAPAVTSARLNSNGAMIVTLINGDGWTYSKDMFTWQRLSEAWWAVGSQYWNTTDSSVGNLIGNSKGIDSKLSAGVIPYLERATTNEVLLRGRAYFLQRLVKSLVGGREGYEGFESAVSVAHLENRVAAAMQLGAKEEFRIALYMYARRIGSEGLRGKVEELLRGLMGGVMKPEGDAGGAGFEAEGDVVCGWKREELLRAVVLILGKHRELQRITLPYARVLGTVNEDNQPTADGEPEGDGDEAMIS